MADDRVLIYDAECRMCTAAKDGLERAGADVRCVPYQSDEAARRLGSRYRHGRPDVAFLVGADGSVREGADAFVPLLEGFRGGGWLARLLRLRPFRPLAHLVYRIIARNRYRWFGAVQHGDEARRRRAG
jgi:predicted DCC family thiol-disulfide oxidoreductase YuxK